MMFTRIITALLLATVLQSANSKDNYNRALLAEIHSPEIRSIMRKLNVLLFERERTHLELQRLRRQQLLLLAEETQALSRAATGTPLIESLAKLDDEQLAMFKGLANELETIARQLGEAEATTHKQELEAAYIRLQETCNTCHQLFRAW